MNEIADGIKMNPSNEDLNGSKNHNKSVTIGRS